MKLMGPGCQANLDLSRKFCNSRRLVPMSASTLTVPSIEY